MSRLSGASNDVLRVLCVLAATSLAIGAGARRSPAEPEPFRVALAHILVRLREAPEPADRPRRDRDAAHRLALDLRRQALAPNADFTALCKRHSEDLDRRANGGYLGTVMRQELSDAFGALEAAAFELQVGEISPVVASPLGFHILRRVGLEEWRGREIFIALAPPSTAVERSRHTALALAGRVVKLARLPGASFATLARRYSDGRERIRDGELGVFGRGERPPEICETIASLEVGEISEPVESESGFHVVLREPLDARRFALIRIPAVDDGGSSRDAKELAERVRQTAANRVQDFAALARRHSDHPRARYGGDLGRLPAERLPRHLRAAGAKLKVGHVSTLIENRRVFFILARLADDSLPR